MAHLLVFVLDNPDQYPDILDAWRSAGVTGLTILESSGLRDLTGELRDDLPLFPSLLDLLECEECEHRTLLTVIEGDDTLERVITATEECIGDFSQHHTGLLFVVPVTRVLGLKKQVPRES